METQPPQQGEGAFKALRVTRYLILLVLLGLGVHLILPQIASLKHSIQVIKDMIIWVVGLAMIAQVASYLGSGYLLKALVQLSGSSLSISRGAMIALASASFGMVAGGMVGSSAATYRWMQKKGINPEAATLAGTIPGLFNDIVLICVTLVGLIHLLVVHQLSRIQGISFGLILLFLISLIGLMIWGQRRRENLMALADKISYRWARFSHQIYQPQRTRDWLDGLFGAVNLILRGGWRGPLLGAVLNVAFDMLTIYLLFIAARHPVSLGVLLTGYGLPLLMGKMAFMIPGGVGVVESTMTALYTSLGVPYSVAVVVVLAYRILSFWLPLILGFPLILILEKQGKESGK